MLSERVGDADEVQGVKEGHPFYTRLNALLDANDFDEFVEGQCVRFYAPVMGRPSLAPGRYFRLLLVGYFEAGLRGDVAARYVRNRTRV